MFALKIQNSKVHHAIQCHTYNLRIIFKPSGVAETFVNENLSSGDTTSCHWFGTFLCPFCLQGQTYWVFWLSV